MFCSCADPSVGRLTSPRLADGALQKIMQLQKMDALLGSGGGSRPRLSAGPSTGSTVKGSKMLMRLRSWFATKGGASPKGYVSVDAGKETNKTRYLIPISFLTQEEFRKLLDKSVAEFGHSHTGALRLACGEQELETVLHIISLRLRLSKLRTGHCLQLSSWYRKS